MLTPQQALKQYFGFDHFREGQEEAIQHILKGQSALLVMPTGSGKSLTYQLPALLKPGLTLVISPLIALMKDQVDTLVENGLPATYINSSLPTQEINQRLRALREGNIKLLYIAPERLRSRNFTRILANTQVSLLAVDEAHCISQWGHDFRPDYLQIGATWQAMGKPTLLATTATATPKVQQDIVKLLGLKQAKTIVTGFNRPNLTYRVTIAPDVQTKLQTLQALLSNLEGSVIIYAATRRNTEEVADFIRTMLGIPAQAYHAGLDRQIRYRVQTDFMADRLKVVVATNAFGMGVDKPDVRQVIHYNMPSTVEAYYQEAGRAGRDGLPAECILFFSPDDQGLQQWMITSDTPSYPELEQVYHLLTNSAREGEVYFHPRELAEMTGLHPVKIRVTLSELELAGAILHMGHEGGYNHWKVLPHDRRAIEERARAIEERAQIRLDLLAKMIDYAYLTTCRRRYLLSYFGDTTPPKSPHCCDNHTGDRVEELPKAVTPQEWFPLIILETVRSLHQRPIGRRRLAQLLNGSRSKAMQQFGYENHKFYGKLQMLSQVQVGSLIDALIAAKYLRITGGELPVLTLSSTGQQALEARAAIPVQVSGLDLADDSVDRWRTRADRSDTVMQTFELFEQGLQPDQIAAERNLAESTIYTHLARLIGDGKVELHQLISPVVEAQVLEAVQAVGNAAVLRLIKDQLPDIISFGQIRCVLAAHPELPRNIEIITDRPQDIAPDAAQKLEHVPETSETHYHSPAPQPPNASAPPQLIPDTIVLEAVAKLDSTLGRTGLAQFLTGSQAGWLEAFKTHSYYGRLTDLSQKAAMAIIDALISDGKLRTTGGNRPKVVLADPNLTADQPPPPAEVEPTTNDLDETTPSTPQREQPQAQSDAVQAEPAQPNQTILEALRQWRTEQARTQSMPPYIIFPNKVLEAIASHCPTTLAELSAIAGIGPAKLEQYGAAVIAIVQETPTGEEPVKPASASPPSDPLQIKEKAPSPASSRPAAPASQQAGTSPETAASHNTDQIISVVADLDGLLTIEGIAQLLTAAPGDVVSFSDHDLCGVLHGSLTCEDTVTLIEQLLQDKRLALSPLQRLTLL